MNKTTLLVGLALCGTTSWALGPQASAQVTGSSTSQTVTFSGFNPYAPGSGLYSYSGPVPNSSVQLNFGAEVYSYENYQVSTNINNATGYVDFANNVSSQGNFASTSTSTTVTVNYKNDTSTTVSPTLTSTITPAGFGFYTANTAANPTLSTGGVAGNINNSPEEKNTTFFDQIGVLTSPMEQVGSVSVSYEILNGATDVADYSASLKLYLTDPNTNGLPTAIDVVLSQSSTTGLTLKNFGLIAADNPNNAVGYEWDATPVSIALSSLAPGQSSTLTYISTASATTSDSSALSNAELLGYAGFGDPIGRTGGAGGIADPSFPLIKLSTPTFDPTTGDLSALSFSGYTRSSLPIHDLDSTNDPSANPLLAVPEPGTWALMLVGVGGIGVMLRRRIVVRPAWAS